MASVISAPNSVFSTEGSFKGVGEGGWGANSNVNSVFCTGGWVYFGTEVLVSIVGRRGELLRQQCIPHQRVGRGTCVFGCVMVGVRTPMSTVCSAPRGEKRGLRCCAGDGHGECRRRLVPWSRVLCGHGANSYAYSVFSTAGEPRC